MITGELVDHFREYGWGVVDELDAGVKHALPGWVDEVASWPAGEAQWLQHYEGTDTGPMLCRSENFVPFHDGLRALLCSGALVEVASALLGEPAVLYKEKVNYKQPGGAGYSPHQDAPAYRFVATHVSCMVAVDDALVGNGCLEVVSACHQELLPTDDTGCIRPDVADGLDWVPVEVQAGETLWLHSRTPHRSGPNLGSTPRRALYPTYNARREGDLRDAYYEQKAIELAGGSAVSLIGDFQGKTV